MISDSSTGNYGFGGSGVKSPSMLLPDCPRMAGLPPEAQKLLAVSASEFVAERGKLMRELRDAGRKDDAQAVAGLRKPSAVVLAVNRAARDRPQAARASTEAARRVGDAVAEGDMDAYQEALSDLQQTLDLLSEVAVAHVAPLGRPATEAMRRRVRELLRRTIADDAGRAALIGGVLTQEQEPAGFSVYQGMSVQRRRGAGNQRRAESKPERGRRIDDDALRKELARAEDELRAAERAVQHAERERARAKKAAAAIRAKLERPG
jgi:hypothetical protein